MGLYGLHRGHGASKSEGVSEREGEHLSKELLGRESSVQKTLWEKEWCRKSLGRNCGVMNAEKLH